ncbi:asparagine synthase-related protein [Agrobacterium tumefaciens]|uniref:Asparagine synthetase domain-containing protein n=1 Tax=Agrobacterium tumefaciens TaxID=358 RepID=A0AAW8M2P8_AGRTU|nr:asparagine synthase-related protein [Agrobacterium tumefaciens]MBP2568752.1 hypothetical protein [Agrobacterium tumefaciens]MBP2574087.1 hypothetical protein [Agrobacterium tumefaciens]MDP9875664.1 hypothetical protein [Agrobacterium tumefaciens]MDP9980577.1 hypothetical protein [Agrobacterium tumefaciens]MDR6705552.1 hypothetical protein [Agrobacterium tumefaciens]
MLVIVPHAYRDLVAARMNGTIPKTSAHIVNDGHTFYFDGCFVSIPLNNGTALFSAPSIMRHVTAGKENLLAGDFISSLQNAVGPFLAVVVTDTEFSIVSSLYRHRDVFYWNYEEQWCATDDLSVVETLSDRRSLNVSFARDFVLDTLACGPETMFEGLHQVELGTSHTFTLEGGVRRKLINLPAPPQADLAEVLIENISHFAAGKERVIVRFSGGLDSSLILAATMEAIGSCEALHTIIPEDSQHTELDIAEDVARNLGCKLNVLRSSYRLSDARKEFRGTRTVSSPFDVYPFSRDATDRSGAFLEGFSTEDKDRAIFLSGQGGDNVFMQNPPLAIVKDALFEHGPIAFGRETIKLSRLKSISIFEILHRAFSRNTSQVQKRIVDARPTKPHLLIENLSSTSARYQYLRSIFEALQQYETFDEFGVASIHPLLLQNMVALAINIDIRSLYSARYDRMPQRKQLHSRYNLDVSWRRTKKSATGAVFLYFMNNRDVIRDTLLDGIVAPALAIDRRWLQNTIDYNGTVAITDDFALVYNLLRLEIFCQQHAGKLR